MDFGIRCRIARVSASARFLTADRLEDITYRFSRICIEYKFLTAGNEDNGNLVFSVTETFCKADPIVFTQHNIKNQNVTAFGSILQCIF